MFSGIQAGSPRQQRVILAASLGVHFLFLAWILHSPPPIFIQPSFIKRGENGTSTAAIYFPGQPHYSREYIPAKKDLTWNPARPKKAVPQQDQVSVLESQNRTSESLLGNQPRSGSEIGTLSYGLLAGSNIKPALPYSSPDPVFSPQELPDEQGDVIIEITIDEAGKIIDSKIVQSMNPYLDQKVLAAVQRWQFNPATRNGVPIASKQDVYYHFPR